MPRIYLSIISRTLSSYSHLACFFDFNAIFFAFTGFTCCGWMDTLVPLVGGIGSFGWAIRQWVYKPLALPCQEQWGQLTTGAGYFAVFSGRGIRYSFLLSLVNSGNFPKFTVISVQLSKYWSRTKQLQVSVSLDISKINAKELSITYTASTKVLVRGKGQS